MPFIGTATDMQHNVFNENDDYDDDDDADAGAHRSVNNIHCDIVKLRTS